MPLAQDRAIGGNDDAVASGGQDRGGELLDHVDAQAVGKVGRDAKALDRRIGRHSGFEVRPLKIQRGHRVGSRDQRSADAAGVRAGDPRDLDMAHCD
jgi:hypothetical protein